MQAASDLSKTRIALDHALGGLDEWTADYRRCAFIEQEHGHAIVIETTVAECVRVSLRRREGDELEERAAWNVAFDDNSKVLGVFDDDSTPMMDDQVRLLNDTLWLAHRLAVEDAAAMLRS
jgi:hypothetical protein